MQAKIHIFNYTSDNMGKTEYAVMKSCNEIIILLTGSKLSKSSV